MSPEEIISLAERLAKRATTMNGASPVGTGDGNTYALGYYDQFAAKDDREAASLIQSQAARIAELEAGLLVARKWIPAGHRNGLTATENMERDAVDALLNGGRKG